MEKDVSIMADNLILEARENDNTLRGLRLENQQWLEEDFSSLELEYVVFDHCRFDDCDFYSANFYKTEFISCDFSNCRFQKSYWNHSTIHSSKGNGAVFTESVFKYCTLSESQFQYANFPKVLFEHTSFIDTSFAQASFQSGVFKQAKMKNVILSGAELFHAQLGKLDLSRCAIDAIRVSTTLTELRGININPGQAVDIIPLLGIQLV